MKNIIQEALQKIPTNTMQSLTEHWLKKVLASVSVTALASTLGVHIQFVLAFVFLMALDTLTRYLAQTALLWQGLYPQTPFTLVDLWKFRVQSRKWRYFRSHEMRKKFVSKLGTYIVILSASAVCDLLMSIAKGQTFALMICTAFLSLTELCSILENLQECGVKEVQDIVSIIKKRQESIQ